MCVLSDTQEPFTAQQLLKTDSKPKRASQEESTLLQNGGAHEGRPRADSDQAYRPRQDSTGQNTYSAGSSFSRMRSLLEQQMGISRYGFTHYWAWCVVGTSLSKPHTDEIVRKRTCILV